MILELDVEDGAELIIKAYEKLEEEKAFQLYVARYSWMDEENFVPFHEFFNPQKLVTQTEQKSESDILTEVKEILDSYVGGDDRGNL